jgi:hypothetical protein
MMNASVDIGQTIDPKAEGETDVMQPLASDSDNNGIPDGADKYPSFLKEFFVDPNDAPVQPRARLFGITHIQGSWVSLSFVFFEPGVTLEIGQTVVTFNPALGYPSITILQDPTSQAAPGAITDFCSPLYSANLTLGQTLDNPCSPAATPRPAGNCPVGQEGAPDVKERGYPLFPCDVGNTLDEDDDGKVNDGCPQVNTISETGAECDNATSDDGEDSSVNDGCQQSGEVSEGGRVPGGCSGTDEGGCTYRSNPATGGTYNFTSLALSQRDADGDGFENGLDVCALEPNPNWDPRLPDAVNDPDLDGLPNECDPSPNEAGEGSPVGCKSGLTGADEDGDCFANRADNCPTDNQLEDPSKPPDVNDNVPLAEDTDKDGIGDACDPNLNDVNGDYIGYCLKFPIVLGGAAAPSIGQRESTPGPECAAQVVGPTTVITPPGQTPRPSGAGSGGGGGSSGVGGGPSSGVGSLSTTATGFPLWAAILAGLGTAGVISGLALFAHVSPRRER